MMLRVLSLIAIALLVSCGQHGGGKVTLLIDWQPEPTYIGLYYAAEQGYFAERGVDIQFENSWGSVQATKAVSVGKYKIATSSGGATILSRNYTDNVVSLLELYPEIPSALYSFQNTPLAKPSDIYGKKVGIYPGSVNTHEFDAFVKANGLDRKKFEVVPISGADIPLLKAGNIDMALNYTEMSANLASTDESLNVNELHLRDFGVRSVGLNLITSSGFLSEGAGVVRGVVEAVKNGYREGCSNRRQAVAAFLKSNASVPKNHAMSGWNKVCDELYSPSIDREASWSRTIKMYSRLGLLKTEVDTADVIR